MLSVPYVRTIPTRASKISLTRSAIPSHGLLIRTARSSERKLEVLLAGLGDGTGSGAAARDVR